MSLKHGGHTAGPFNHFPGGHRSRATPVPIPNTVVKPATADGTAEATLWESRSLPGISQPDVEHHAPSGFFFVRLVAVARLLPLPFPVVGRPPEAPGDTAEYPAN